MKFYYKITLGGIDCANAITHPSTIPGNAEFLKDSIPTEYKSSIPSYPTPFYQFIRFDNKQISRKLYSQYQKPLHQKDFFNSLLIFLELSGYSFKIFSQNVFNKLMKH